jgi:hypothetical protein
MVRATIYGVAAAQAVALVSGLLEDPIGLSWGLIVVGLVGGWAVGAAVVAGAFSGRFHLILPRVRWLAALIAVVAWIEAAVVGYVASQLFYQGPATPLLDRLSLSGFIEYLNGSVFSPSIIGLAVMAFMAWRSAR